MAEKTKDTWAEFVALKAMTKVQLALACDKIRMDLDGFVRANHQFGRKVVELGDLVSSWWVLGDFSPPLGDNPVGRAVADRFVTTSARFVTMLGDYRGKLGDAHGAMDEMAVETARADCSGHEMLVKAVDGAALPATWADKAVVPLDGWSGIRTQDCLAEWVRPEWTPADKYDWRTYSSKALHEFATIGNNPESVFTSIAEWLLNTDSLQTSSTDFKNNVGQIMSTWEGAAANAAHGALMPLARWGDDATGNANRLREHLEYAGNAAVRLKGMPGPVEEPTVSELLHTGLAVSPADVVDLQERVRHAKAVKAEQVRYMEQYENAMAAVYDALPDFHLAPVPVVDDPGGPPVPGPYPDPGGGPADPIGVPPVRSAGSPPPAGAPESQGTSGETGENGRSGMVAQVTPAGTVSSSTADLSGTRLPNPGTAVDAGTTTRGGGPFAVGGVSFGNQGAGNFGPGRGAGTPGEGRGAEGRGAEGRGASGTRGPAAAEAPPVRRGTGAMPAGVPANRPERDEDIEHQRPSYLVERDPQGLFGTTERTAPPVIG